MSALHADIQIKATRNAGYSLEGGHDKKLRIKLIVASMISLFLVLFIIGGIAGVLNYRKIVEDADRILEVWKKCRTFSENDSGKRKRGQTWDLTGDPL